MTVSSMRRFVVVGGAGFIGAHFVEHLLARPGTEQVTVFDNFSSGRRWHLDAVAADPRLTVTVGDVGDLEVLCAAVEGHDTVIHLASNPDIAAAVTNPAIDFDQGTVLTHHVAEAARRCRGRAWCSTPPAAGSTATSASTHATEDHGPMVPTSTYGASKLAGEAILASYAAMFEVNARCFRFGNVVGPRQTHGVGFDFVRRLLDDPSTLRILGDGRQSKSYIHVDDVIAAVLLAAEQVRSRSQCSMSRPRTT